MQNFDASMLTGALEMVTNADAKNTIHEELKYQMRTVRIWPMSAP